eukprot:CAMPEP_0182912218 /NCGR_PEP_ID=MMETSP0034_2-20130328/37399_1 /TAXON_ID=156128 /ORGANISM="Nephroselmis pyriformis, Strain CCMP717" /LENGTH=220 /DNA_ID=CAMNT_0025048875 /DNA_START=38 /DNA_END=700 /DNA_ORIENTATION=-
MFGSAPKHPYYPVDLKLPGYVPNSWSQAEILGLFFGGLTPIILYTWGYSGKVGGISIGDRLQIVWFICCGIIHTFVEGAFSLMPEFYKDTSGNFFASIWKEYSMGDSRYASGDAFVYAMETVTAFVEGPLCFLIAYGITKKAPWRLSLALAVSIGQLYGDVLYYFTCFIEGLGKHCAPGALYFWFYFVVMNAIWIVVPAIVVYDATCRINKACAGGRKAE